MVEDAKAASIAAVSNSHAEIQSRLTTFRRDATFVEVTKKLNNDMDRFHFNMTVSRAALT